MSAMTSAVVAAPDARAFASSPQFLIRSDVSPNDRRYSPRARLSGEAFAVFSDSLTAGKLATIELVDGCAGGFGVRCPFAVEPGASFSMTPESGKMGRHVGMVVRCEADGDGYRLGLRSRGARAA